MSEEDFAKFANNKEAFLAGSISTLLEQKN
jgi:hypothetical protein